MKRLVLIFALLFPLWANAQTAIRTLAESLSPGQVGILNERGDASGYGPGLDNPQYGGNGAGLSQSAKCEWDPTPYRAYGFPNYVGTWVGYKVSSGYSAGATSVAVDNGTEPIVPGMLVNFRGVTGAYTVTSGIPAGGAGTISFTPSLASDIADNTDFTIVKAGERILYLGHSHTAQTNSWPAWVVYESYDDKWKSPSTYRHFNIVEPDQYQDALTYGWFHQNSGLAFNPGKQLLYRQHPGGNPTITNRIYTDAYNPLDIGKITPFALTGTLTFTNDSFTVTGSGTNFDGELVAGYQIWLNGDELYDGVSQRIVTVASVESDTSLTLVNKYTGSASPGAASAHNPATLYPDWRFEPGGNISSSGSFSSIAVWPERDSLFLLDSRSGGVGGIYEKRTTRGDSAAWTTVFNSGTTPAFAPTSNTGFVNILHYNTKRHSLLVGVGIAELVSGVFSNGFGGLELWEITLDDPNDPINSTLSITALDSLPQQFYVGSPAGDLVFHDPITGKYLFISVDWSGAYPNGDYIFSELDPDAMTGSQITDLDGSIFSQLSGDIYGNINTNVVACVADTLGVAIFMGTDNVYVYKHTANTRATDGLTTNEKRTGPGVIGYAAWGEGFELKYAYPASLAEVYAPLATAMTGETNWPITQARTDLEGNMIVSVWPAFDSAPRTDSGDGVGGATIDTGTTYKGEPGSLQFITKNQTGQSIGELLINIDGTHGTGSNHKQISPTMNAMASSLYYQYAIRADANMLQTYPGHLPTSTFAQFPVTTSGVDSATIELLTDVADMSWIGKKVYVDWIVAQDWIPGFYTIAAVPSAGQITLNAVPTMMGTQGMSGAVWIEEDETDSMQGTKIGILSGKAPGLAASTLTELAVVYENRGDYPLYLGPYGQQGQQGFGGANGMGGPLEPDTWSLVSWQIDFRPTSDDFYAIATDSVFVSSPSITFSASWAAFMGSFLWFSGYGPNSYDVDSSDCVPGLYRIIDYDAMTNSIELDASPSRMGTAAAGCEAYLSVGNVAGLTEFAKNRIRVWKDNLLVTQYDNARIGFAENPNDNDEEYGLGVFSLSVNGNYRDTTFVHADGYTLYSHPVFSRQPLSFRTATLDEAPPSGVTSSSGRLRNFR